MIMEYLWWKDFLDVPTLELVRHVTKSNRDKFVPTTVTTGVDGYRKSTVLWHYNYIELYDLFTGKIKAMTPIVMQLLNMDFPVGDVELQMTRSGHDEYFKNHVDNGTDDTAMRQLTFVYYYLLTEHRQFEGGDLIIRPPSGDLSISPNHNSIIFFPSHYWHEVMPVTYPDDTWEGGRFTLNGWCRKPVENSQ